MSSRAGSRGAGRRTRCRLAFLPCKRRRFSQRGAQFEPARGGANKAVAFLPIGASRRAAARGRRGAYSGRGAADPGCLARTLRLTEYLRGNCFNKDGMTSETDDKAGRRPPTIELAATEVDSAADKATAGDPGTGAAEHATAGANAPASPLSARRFTSHVASALIGAAVMAGAAAALWFAGVIPSRETTPVGTAASDTSAAPSNPAPNPPPNPPPSPAAAQNVPVAPELTARLDKIEGAIETPRNDPALNSRIAEIAGQTTAFTDNLAALTRRVDDIAARSQSAAKAADIALNAAETAKS